jgi:aminoglycoside phosphotransferase (APT) family kinase protein
MSAGSDAGLRAWVAANAGAEVVRFSALGSGNSRATYAVEVRARDGVDRLIVRHDEGGGPVAGTELSLAREALVYEALAGRGLPVPTLLGRSDDGGTIIVERMPGRPGDTEPVLSELLAHLAALHNVPAVELNLPGFARGAVDELDLWARIAAQKLGARSDLVDLAFELLRERFPGEPERLVLCHGDFGEGNFLVEDGRVSALLDWEFAHLGDPHDDLAWITVRALMFGHALPGFDALVRAHYAPAAGVRLSQERLRYWQAVTVLRNLICCLAVADAPAHQDRSVHLMLIPGLAFRLVRLLAGVSGIAIGPPAPLPPPRALPGDPLLQEAARGIGELVAEIPDALARRRARRLSRMLSQFVEHWQQASVVAEANAADTATADTDRESRLRLLARTAERELTLLPHASPIAGGALAGLEESK